MSWSFDRFAVRDLISSKSSSPLAPLDRQSPCRESVCFCRAAPARRGPTGSERTAGSVSGCGGTMPAEPGSVNDHSRHPHHTCWKPGDPSPWASSRRKSPNNFCAQEDLRIWPEYGAGPILPTIAQFGAISVHFRAKGGVLRSVTRTYFLVLTGGSPLPYIPTHRRAAPHFTA